MMNEPTNSSFKRKLYCNELVFIDGFGRTGKFMLASIVSSLNRIEHLQMSWILEYIPVLYHMDKITSDAAVSLLHTEIENNLYCTMIGRNVNFRVSDVTGVWNAKAPEIYIERLLTEEGDIVYDKIASINPILLFLTHDVLCHGDIFFEAFPFIKIVHIERHPIDVIDSWYRKRTESMIDNPRNLTPRIKGRTKKMPWYAKGWEEMFETLPHMDRVIHSFNAVYRMRERYLQNINQDRRNNILMIRFEDMVTDPMPTVSKICSFIETQETLHTPIVLKKERCPRELTVEDRRNKQVRIKRLASSDAFDLLMELVQTYEKK
jgi:hypothetical protein